MMRPIFTSRLMLMSRIADYGNHTNFRNSLSTPQNWQFGAVYGLLASLDHSSLKIKFYDIKVKEERSDGWFFLGFRGKHVWQFDALRVCLFFFSRFSISPYFVSYSPLFLLPLIYRHSSVTISQSPL